MAISRANLLCDYTMIFSAGLNSVLVIAGLKISTAFEEQQLIAFHCLQRMVRVCCYKAQVGKGGIFNVKANVKHTHKSNCSKIHLKHTRGIYVSYVSQKQTAHRHAQCEKDSCLKTSSMDVAGLDIYSLFLSFCVPLFLLVLCRSQVTSQNHVLFFQSTMQKCKNLVQFSRLERSKIICRQRINCLNSQHGEIFKESAF